MTESKSVALPLGYTPTDISPMGYTHRVKKMGRVVGLEPTHNGATIRRVNHFTIPATTLHMTPKSYDKKNYTIGAVLRQTNFKKS